MSNALHLHARVVVDDVVQRLQTHLHLLESVCMLALLAGVHIRCCHLDQGVEVLGIGPNEVQQTVSKSLGILTEREREEIHQTHTSSLEMNTYNNN